MVELISRLKSFLVSTMFFVLTKNSNSSNMHIMLQIPNAVFSQCSLVDDSKSRVTIELEENSIRGIRKTRDFSATRYTR